MTALQEFFTRYAETSTSEAYSALPGFYAPSFIAAGPNGQAVYKNDEKFAAWLDDIHIFNQETGLAGMKVLNVTGENIGKTYVMAKVTWAASYRKTGTENVVFDIHYLLYYTNNKPQIVMYISGEEQEEVMKDKGLL